MAHEPINDRRRILLIAAAGVCATGMWPAFTAARSPSFRSDPFALGVASGSPTSDGFVLWTRLIDDGMDPYQAVQLRWEVFEDEKPTAVVAAGDTVALPDLAHSVHVEVSGLKPDRWYGYRFLVGDAVSTSGRTRTLPLPEAVIGKLRFAYASCQRWEDGYYAAYRHMLADRPDMVVFLGDYIYENAARDPAAVRPHALPSIRTLQDFRQRYALHKSDPNLQRMHAACPWLVTWDDHEVENDYVGLLSVRERKNFPARRAVAYQAFYEHMPLRISTLVNGLRGLYSGRELRIYNHISFGKLARFYVLDDRQYRAPPMCKDEQTPNYAAICEPSNPASQSMLGTVQEGWLKSSVQAAAQERIGWNFLAQQTAFAPRNYIHGYGKNFVQDSWDGYPGSRERLLAALNEHKPNNPVFLGGNIHQNWVANVHYDPYDTNSPIIASEFCGTSISSKSTPQKHADRIAKENPHCLLDNSEKRGYGLVEIETNRMTVRLRALENVANPDSEIGTLASFVVESGNPQIHRGS